jgi:thiamine biosynthesis lipoprotein
MYKIIHIFAFLAIFMSFWSCKDQNTEWREAHGSVWATSYNIKYQSDKNLDDSLLVAMKEVENALSGFNPESEISRVNRGLTDQVGELARVVFVEAQRVNHVSGGAFDPTVAPLVNLWGFGYKNGAAEGSEPDSTAIADALKRVGMNRCAITSDGHITKVDPATEFDFNAITKGYGVDRVADALRRNGVQNFMVEIGGEVITGGTNPDGRAWHIQIDAPVVDNSATHRRLTVIEVDGRGIATSGNYRNYKTLADGSRVGHTISAKTGRPVTTTTLSATVIAPTTMTADALATATMAMPLDSARLMLEREPRTGALIVTAAPDGSYQLITVGDWPGNEK